MVNRDIYTRFCIIPANNEHGVLNKGPLCGHIKTWRTCGGNAASLSAALAGERGQEAVGLLTACGAGDPCQNYKYMEMKVRATLSKYS